MTLAFYLSAFTLGFLGSFHCAGMCGPIALMLPKSNASKSRVLKGRVIYNSGRVVTYISLGLIFGLLGFAVAMKGFQRELSVLTGVIILITVLLSVIRVFQLKIYHVSTIYSDAIRKNLKKLFSNKSLFSLFLIGVLNGLLPCGFVYLAIAGAAASGSVTGGITYMALFGLGTFPMMMMISVAANFFGIRFKKIFAGISSFIAIALAVFLIYRGTIMKTENCHSESKSVHSAVYCPVPSDKSTVLVDDKIVQDVK